MLGKVFLNNFLAYEMYGSKNRTQVKISLQEKTSILRHLLMHGQTLPPFSTIQAEQLVK